MAKRTAVPDGKQRLRVATGVYLKPNGKYLATYRDPGHRQHWKEFASKKEALTWRARATVDPSSVVEGKRTLDEVFADLMHLSGSSLRPTTVAN